VLTALRLTDGNRHPDPEYPSGDISYRLVFLSFGESDARSPACLPACHLHSLSHNSIVAFTTRFDITLRGKGKQVADSQAAKARLPWPGKNRSQRQKAVSAMSGRR
jgi:hypothetical protein